MKQRLCCKHYAGLIDFTKEGSPRVTHCDAGVCYEDVETEKLPYRRGLPCFEDGPDTCDKREFPTAEEIEAEECETAKMVEEMFKVRYLIEEDAGPYVDGAGAAGSISCPICKDGTVSYSRAGINAHIWARCSTEGCVSWME